MKVLVVDDHAVVRAGVRRLLARLPGAEVHDASSVIEALAVCQSDVPDVVVLDISLDGANGLDLLKQFQDQHIASRVVVFTMHSDLTFAIRALKAGAAGYVTKSAGSEELLKAVEAVATGERYLDPALASDLVLNDRSSVDEWHKLTDREADIMRLLGDGLSLAEIATKVGRAYKSVATACAKIRSKLGVDRTSDLVRLAAEQRVKAKGH